MIITRENITLLAQQAKIAAEEGIEYSNTVLRSSPTTLFIKQVLNLTDEQVDEIFINADKVEA